MITATRAVRGRRAPGERKHAQRACARAAAACRARNSLGRSALCLESVLASDGLEGLLERARRRDPAALDELVTRYSSRLFGLLYRLTGSRDVSEDLLQETYLRMVRTIGEYEHVGRFEAWLFRIAANLARDRARKHARRGEASPLAAGREDEDCPGGAVPEAPTGDPWAALERDESVRALAAALQELPAPDREVLLLRHYGELSFKEIAEYLEIPLGTALARAHRALLKLKAKMRTAEDE
ncbi:MAG: RNA polymerase sigma factor [Phycisphaerales bacterium]|nr:RNA polymerase sigma factor [Phycisphaerales bacterium]